MSNSKDDEVKKSGMILRTDVFYEPEYRELCLQQLNMYNETKMSSNYLKDLIGTEKEYASRPVYLRCTYSRIAI